MGYKIIRRGVHFLEVSVTENFNRDSWNSQHLCHREWFTISVELTLHSLCFITVMSPTEVFGDAPYFAVFCLAMSSRIVWLTALPNPYVRMMTELLSSKFLSLMVWKISSFFPSEGAPSVRNKMTLFFFTPDSSETEPFSRLNAFSNANLYWVCPVNQKEHRN